MRKPSPVFVGPVHPISKDECPKFGFDVLKVSGRLKLTYESLREARQSRKELMKAEKAVAVASQTLMKAIGEAVQIAKENVSVDDDRPGTVVPVIGT